jgi:hypothetical protein
MARILIAWELGSNLGHAGQFMPLAGALRAAGHSVWLALKNGASAHRVAAQGFGYLEAPVVWGDPAEQAARMGLPVEPVQSYADLLRGAGWCDPQALARALSAWRNLFQLTQPDVLLCHAAPTAQLAARGEPMQVARLGTGFECPPASVPFAPMRYWEPLDGPAMARREQHLFARVQEALRIVDASSARAEDTSAESLADLLGPATDLLCTLPELDHYPRRQALQMSSLKPRSGETRATKSTGDGKAGLASGAGGNAETRRAHPGLAPHYYGPLLTQQQGVDPVWPGHGGANILAYLRPPFAAALDLLRTLRQGPWNTLLVMPGWPEAEARALASPNLNVATSPVRMDRALQQCAAVITYGGHGTVAGSLLAGKPVLNLPKNTEQLLVSRNAARTGAGAILSAEIQGQDMSAAIARLIDTPDFAAAAKAFAASHTGLDTAHACTSLVAAVEDLKSGGSPS